MSKWIKKLTEAYSEVNENTKMANAKALAKATASSEKGKAAVTLPKAPFDIPKKAEKMPIVKKEAMDPVNHKALKGKHKDRDDTDIDNDGDTDSSDKYLHKRRKAISKNVKDGDEVEMNPKKKKDKGASTANADAEMAESTMPSVYARILENRAAHYKKAAPAQDKEDGMAPMTKKAKADMEAGAKMDDTEEKGHVDAAKAGRAGPGRKPRRNDNMKGDKSVIPSATKMKEALAAVYDTSTSPLIFEKTSSLKVDRNHIGQSAKELGGSGSLGHGAHDLMHPNDDHGEWHGASAYGHVDKKTKKFKAVQVKFGHSTSAKKVAKAMGHKEVGPHHHAIADYHNETNAEFMGQKAGDKVDEEVFAAVNESEDSKVTSSIEKKDPDAMHMSTHGSQHVYIGGQSDRENHSYHVHDTSTGKTHHVSLDHGGKAMSHGAVKSACGSKVNAAACKAIHSDHTDELS